MIPISANEPTLTALAARAAHNLRSLGEEDAHPAAAVVGIRCDGAEDVQADGWAALPTRSTHGVRATTTHLLDLASVTKVAATTTIAMRLAAAGRLDIDRPARHYLPALLGPGKDAVTIRHLLTHTSGVQPWWPFYLESRRRQDAIDRSLALPLVTEPGTAWRYSDLGLILVGRAIERITNQRLDTVFAKLVAEPLGLNARYGPVPANLAFTSADSDATEFRMVATGTPYDVPFTVAHFTAWRNEPIRGFANDGNASFAMDGVSGHAGLFASAGDLLRLGTALRNPQFVPTSILTDFAEPSPIRPDQAVGFRRSSVAADGEDHVILHHGGFTGTWFGIGLDDDLVLAGGATRLHIGHNTLPTAGEPAPAVATNDDIGGIFFNAAAEALATTSRIR